MVKDIFASVIAKGSELLRIGAIENAELFLTGVDEYLLEVGKLEQELKSAGNVDKSAAERFMKIHGEIISRAELEKSGVLRGLTELHKRSTILKTYLDQGPNRVSITGKREG